MRGGGGGFPESKFKGLATPGAPPPAGGRGGSRSPDATGEAAAGPGVAAVGANTPSTTAVSATGSSLVPETELGVLTRSGGLGETIRAGGLGESMRSGLAHGTGRGDSLRSGLWSGSARGGSILPSLGRWAKNITTPTGHGDGGLTASFRQRAGLKATGISDAMPTPRNLENVLQQKGEVYMGKEVEGEKEVRTSGGGEWVDLEGGMHGYNRAGVEWLVTVADVGGICGGKINGGTQCCTENIDVCTVKTHLVLKADLKPEWLYMKTTDTHSHRKTASLAWGVPKYICGGQGEELGSTMLKTVEFKRFSEILLAQVDGGAIAQDMPRKVKFQPEPVLKSLEDLGWNDVVPRGATNLDEDSDPAFDNSLRTNQLAINLKLTRMNVETLERCLTKGLVSYEESLESLGNEVHATRVRLGKDSGIYTSVKDSVWEGIACAHVKMDSMKSRIRSAILS
jgi:hypothetical protein